jgi:hypothetical protein
MLRLAIPVLVIIGAASLADAQPLLHRQLGGATIDVARMSSGAFSRDVARVTWASGRTTIVELPDLLDTYQESWIWDDRRLILAGPSRNGGSRLVVVDRDTATVVDSLLAKTPAVAPGGRLIAFARHSPRGLPTEGADVLLVYDVGLLPDQNRMVPSESGIVRMQNAGRAMYPSWNVQAQSYAPVLDPNAAGTLKGPLSWFGDGAVFFVELVAQTAYVVALDLSDGSFSRKELDADQLINRADAGLGPQVPLAPLLQVTEIIPLQMNAQGCRARLVLGGLSHGRIIEVAW